MKKIKTLFILLTFFGASCSGIPVASNEQKGLFDNLRPISSMDKDPDRHLLMSREEVTSIDALRNETAQWLWPLKQVKVTSAFGRRGRNFHEGVDLKAYVGTPVFAVDGGNVIYTGRKIKGYGHMVVLKHESGLYTVYAHLSKSMLKKGTEIIKGQKIALSGRTGRVSGPHLHFEVRKGPTAMDPVKIMPERSWAIFSRL